MILSRLLKISNLCSLDGFGRFKIHLPWISVIKTANIATGSPAEVGCPFIFKMWYWNDNWHISLIFNSILGDLKMKGLSWYRGATAIVFGDEKSFWHSFVSDLNSNNLLWAGIHGRQTNCTIRAVHWAHYFIVYSVGEIHQQHPFWIT